MVVLWHPQDFNGSESLPLLGHSIDEGQEEAGYHSKGQSHPHRLGPVMDECQSLDLFSNMIMELLLDNDCTQNVTI